MMRTECDNCQRLGDAPPPPGWVYLTEVVPPDDPEGLVGMLTGGNHADMKGVFCSYRCIGEYAAAKALVESVEQGPEGTP